MIERLNEGLHRKLTLVSASAGFGKTTLICEWLSGCERPGAWLSLDEGDSDPVRFMTCLVAALQTIAGHVGAGVLSMLQSPQRPPAQSILTFLLNDIASIRDAFILVLDDYHAIDAAPVDEALSFLIEHMPPHIHLVIATREDPQLPLARLRARDQLTELRIADLRFTRSEAASFLSRSMGLQLSDDEVGVLEMRTEGWIAGLQLAAISLQGHPDAAGFIHTFNGSHRYVLDYLMEEVLKQQPDQVKSFLLTTSIMDRLCGPLCDAVTLDSSAAGQETLEYLERTNLFIIPLDDKRRWFRYHHLFADLLRQRQQQQNHIAELHIRASEWFEQHDLELEAFRHACAAGDVERAARLMKGKGMPLHFRGEAATVLSWLHSLPVAVLDARPSLWVAFASALLFVGQVVGVEDKLRAAETAIREDDSDDLTRDLIGHIALIRAMIAVTQHQVDTIIAQSSRALEFLSPSNLPVRTAASWTLGYAYQLQGDRAAARQAYTEAVEISESIGHEIIIILATLGLGCIEEADNQLHLAAATFRNALQLAGDPPIPVFCEAHLGLARIYYEWNDLEQANRHAEQGAILAKQIKETDRFVHSEVFLARLLLARGDAAGASERSLRALHLSRLHRYENRIPEAAAIQVQALLKRGELPQALELAQSFELPLSQARVLLAQGDPAAALAVLEQRQRLAVSKRWADEQLKVMVLQALAQYANGAKEKALQLLGKALHLAEPGGFIRIFVDEGRPMQALLMEAASRRCRPDYTAKLLSAITADSDKRDAPALIPMPPAQPLIEPLSERELRILQLIAQGLSNQEISETLFLALSTVKGYNQQIFGKLQVKRRTEAVAKARELGLL
ncbi:LuxR C-terminal-related transcriptional regulator [Paenibacillus tarimensis]